MVPPLPRLVGSRVLVRIGAQEHEADVLGMETALLVRLYDEERTERLVSVRDYREIPRPPVEEDG